MNFSGRRISKTSIIKEWGEREIGRYYLDEEHWVERYFNTNFLLCNI